MKKTPLANFAIDPHTWARFKELQAARDNTASRRLREMIRAELRQAIERGEIPAEEIG